MATYAVGDLQGCLKPLQSLLQEVKFNRATDTLWLTGDLINRGPQSLDTLRFIYRMRDNVICVQGNHDLHLLAVANGHKTPSRSDTLDEILQAPDRDELLLWLRQRPLLHRDHELGFTMTHAGIPPQWDLDRAEELAEEVNQVLRGDQLQYFLANMYGNTPDHWRDDLSGAERWRVITNYFTRMRFCTPDGKLDFTHKGAPEKAPPGYAPWFEHPAKRNDNEGVIFGHWAALQGKSPHKNLYPLDTGCVWGHCMTMLRLEDGKVFAFNCL